MNPLLRPDTDCVDGSNPLIRDLIRSWPSQRQICSRNSYRTLQLALQVTTRSLLLHTSSPSSRLPWGNLSLPYRSLICQNDPIMSISRFITNHSCLSFRTTPSNLSAFAWNSPNNTSGCHNLLPMLSSDTVLHPFHNICDANDESCC